MDKIEQYLDLKPQFTRAVVGYLVDGENVILGLRKQVSLGLGENLITGIGGKVGDDPERQDETDEEAMIREADEEVGIKVLSMRKVGEITFLFPNKPKWNQYVIAYVVDKWEREPMETGAIKPLAFNKQELPVERMWADNELWVPLVLAGQSVKATFLYGEDNKSIVDYYIEN